MRRMGHFLPPNAPKRVLPIEHHCLCWPGVTFGGAGFRFSQPFAWEGVGMTAVLWRRRILRRPDSMHLLPSRTPSSAEGSARLRRSRRARSRPVPRLRSMAKALVALATAAAMSGAVAAPATAESLAYHGYEISDHPHVYLTFWGKNWNEYSGARTEVR